MGSHNWDRDDLRNILLAVYATKSTFLGEESSSYRWGCEVAVRSLLLALGLSPSLLDDPAAAPLRSSPTERWWIEDLENILSAICRSVLSTPAGEADAGRFAAYRQGFSDTVAAVLEAIGSMEDPRDWWEAAQREQRRWREADSPPRAAPLLPGSGPDRLFS